MKTVFAREPLDHSIFLAGPTPRSPEVESWRPTALNILRVMGFKGTVYVPEDGADSRQFEYDDQIHWEWQALAISTVIVFWVPRDMKTMPALTTNVEFGMFANSGKVLLGCPCDAEKMTYLYAVAQRNNVPVFHSLERLLLAAIKKTKDPYGETPST